MRELLSTLRENNIRLKLIEGELSVKFPKGKVNKTLLDEIKANKVHLIDYLTTIQEYDYLDIPLTGGEEHYPMSSGQRRLWILSQLETGSLAYNMPMAFVFDGQLDIDALQSSLDTLVERHEILRTVFMEDAQGQARQFIKSPETASIQISMVDLRNQPGQEQELARLVDKDAATAFDLAAGPLLRITLYQLADERHVFSYVMHHIISDGWSMHVLVKELLQSYNACVSGETLDLAPLRIQYKDYAAWQQSQLSGTALNEHKSYWLQQLGGDLPVIELPAERPRPAAKSHRGATVTNALDVEVSKGLKSLTQQQGGTLFMGLLAAVNSLLYRYTGQQDIIIGSQIAGREHAELEDQIGLYLNTLALRSRFSGDQNFLQLLEQVKETTLKAYEHQVYPFDELVDALDIQRDRSRHPLFDVSLVLQNTALQDAGAQQLASIQVTPYQGRKHSISKFDLAFDFAEVNDKIEMTLEYDSDLYSRSMAVRMLEHLKQLIAVVISRPDVLIDQINYLSEAEKQQLLFGFNDTAAAFPEDKTLVDLFEEQVAATPENVAVVFEGRSLTYRELNERANRLANYLNHHYSVQPDDLVGIQLQRSELLIVCMLAILKSGGAYVPIDPEYPQDRIEYMIADSGCKVVIDENELAKFESEQEEHSSNNPVHINKPGDVAYVIYTSGTTGKPKGSLIEHRNVVRLLKTDKPLFDFNEHDVWTMFHSFCFDFSVWEIYGAILFGGRVVVIPSLTAKDPAFFLETLRTEKVTVLNQTPSAFYNLIKEEEEQGGDASLTLRYVIFGGEALSPGKLASFNKRYPLTALINMYGITETTVHVTYKKITEKEISSNSSNIGRQIPTLTCYVLDQHQQLLPIGIAGELYVGGEGVCRGYLNRPELTAKKFIDNPFNPGERLYRSGDKAKLLENGEMEYGGRLDDQVKVRGYRIELGEIETAFRRMSKIENVVIIAKSDAKGDTNLIAYLVSNEQLNIADLRQELSSQLPSYMLPAYYVQIENIPLTSNGKVNRKVLPDPEDMGMDSGAEYIAPRNATEEKLVAIWQEILGKERVSINDNFFEIGGHSLKATRLVSQLHKTFNVKIALKDIFTHVVLEQQAKLIDQSANTQYAAIEPVEIQADYPLSSSQRRLWVLSQFEEANVAYKMPAVFVLEGKLDRELLAQAFALLIARHESLRTVFKTAAGGDVRQFILTPGDSWFTVGYHDLRKAAGNGASVKELLRREFLKPFDLQNGPLLRATVYQVKDEKYVFSYIMHHIISDGWSINVLLDDLLQLYNGLDNGNEQPLKPLRIQYKDYSAWQSQQLQGAALQEHRSWWLKQFEGELPVLELPGEKIRPAIKTYNGDFITTTIGADINEGLQNICRQQGGTLFMGLLSAVNALFHRYTGQEDIIIGSPIANRQHADLEGQIGFYANTLALRTRFSGKDNFHQLLSNIKEVTLGAYEHQVYPFDELVDSLHLVRDMSRNPLFDVQVILQNTEAGKARQKNPTGLQVRGYEELSSATCVFDMVFNFFEAGGDLHLTVEYNTDVFEKSAVLRLTKHLEQMMAAIVQQPDLSIGLLNFLSSEDKTKLLVDFNDTGIVYPENKTLVDLFTAQVAKTPEAVALVFNNKTISYQELDEQSNRLAHYLKTNYDIRRDDLVGINLERNERLIVAMLGILKSGAAYVPIDPAYPRSRKEFIIKETALKALITQTDYLFDLDYYDGPLFAIDIQLDSLDTPSTACDAEIHPGDLAYVIYTSGSTGEPKGVMIEHKGIVNTVYAQCSVFDVKPGEKNLQFASPSFDASVSEIFVCLASGGALYIIDEDNKKDPYLLQQYIAQHEIDIATIPPAYLKLIDIEKIRALKKLVTAGEAAIHDKVQQFMDQSRYFNAYGPTESSICATILPLPAGHQLKAGNVPIGTPLPNAQIYIIDKNGLLVPTGVIGEICIGGAGLARGYLNRPDLTSEKFIDNPFAPGQKMYRTGDLGRWLPDGNVEFSGRIDDQVKIRGYRIELAEIESNLRTYPGLESAVVVVRTNRQGDKELAAYFVSNAPVASIDIKNHLSRLMPAYMVPDHFVQLEELPLNTSGKIDKKRLPDPDGAGADGTVSYVPARNETEAGLIAIWQEILDRERISVTDNFFDLGGHSLKATRLVSQIHKEFDVRLELKDVFAKLVLQEQAQLIDEAKTASFVAIEPVAAASDYASSSAQRRLWVVSQFGEANAAYNLPGSYVFEGALNVNVLEFAFNSLVERHEILRTSFFEDEQGRVRQRIRSAIDSGFKMQFHDLRNEPQQEQQLKTLIQQDATTPFDLSNGPLLRATIYQLSENKHVFSYVMHHIISDGWSMNVLVKELLECYNAVVVGEVNVPAPLRIQYKDYAAWQQSQLSGETLQQHKSYWLQQFAGELPVIELPSDKTRPAVKTYNGATVSSKLDATLSSGIRSLSQQHGGTLFMGLLAAVNTLLYRYTGQQDIIIGSQIAGREHADLDNQIGLYLNTLALRAHLKGEDSFLQLLEQIKQTTLKAYEHQVYPFDELVDALDLQRDLGRHPLFDVSVVLHNLEAGTVPRLSNLAVTAFEEDNTISKFDLAFNFAELSDEIYISLVYNTDIYSARFVENLLSHLQQLVAAVITAPETPVGQVNYLTADEQQQLLAGFNDAAVAYPQQSIAALFAEQVEKTPGKIALVFENKQLTYQQLDEQSNRLANHLKASYQTAADECIGIMLDRSDKLMIAILAVLKSGAAYVPVDPEYPSGRKSFMLADTKAKLLITQSDYLFGLDFYQGDVFAIDVQLDTLTASAEAPAIVNSAGDLAYVMYTSGSTGNPKGVMVEHRGVARLVKGSNYISFTGNDTILSSGALCFDATTFEYWGTLLNGGRLVFCSKESLLDDQQLISLINKHAVDTMWFTTGWLNQLVDRNIDVFNGLKTVITGGEKISPVHVAALMAKFPALHIVNCYGPTENTTFSLFYNVTSHSENIPIGRPVSNSTVYIIDNNNQLCPVGIVGEICVGGDGLARGYLNNEALTSEKFVAHPFIPGQRIYRTGDLGKWLADGNINFIGRKDEQVKVRGYRIELGEIENALLSCAGVEGAVVVARGLAGEKELVAYLATRETLNAADIRSHLAQNLPAYMLPDHFVLLQELPLNANGKVDRKQLPDPTGAALETGTAYVAPRNETEERLVKIWQDVLGKDQVSVTDNFFEIGGHSLKATRLASQIHKEFEIRIELKDLFSKTVLEEQAEFIASARKSSFVAIERVPEQDSYTISSSQRRLWVLSQFGEGSVAYNMPGVYVFEGDLDEDALAWSFSSLVERHESLRTIFNIDETARIAQYILPVDKAGFVLTSVDLRNDAQQDQKLKRFINEESMKPFNLSAGPLFRASLYRLKENKWVFSYVMHHIISDGWSMGVLIKELLILYNARLNGQDNPLQLLRIQYKDYAAWQQQQLEGDSLQQHKNYWLQRFEGELSVLELPADRVRPAIKTYNGGVISRTIGKEITGGIREMSRQQGGTLFMGLLAAVNVLLNKYSRQNDIIVGTPIANREHADLEGQIGFYLNTLALRSNVQEQESFTDLLDATIQLTLDAYKHQVYPFDDLIDALQLARDTGRHPLFDVMVILQNADTNRPAGAENFGGLQVSSYNEADHAISKFDLLFDFSENGDVLELSLEYNSDIYDSTTVERFADHLQQLLAAVVEQPVQPIALLDYLTADEKQRLLFSLNDTAATYPADKTLTTLFEVQVAATPDKEALVFAGNDLEPAIRLSYAELNAKANQLARYLKAQYNIGADDLAAIKLERSEWMIISILAVLKAGGAYVPIDPQYPTERIDYIVADSGCKAIIDDGEIRRFLEAEVQDDSNLEAQSGPRNLAYVIYTSGSTGRPKGCMLEHRGVVNRIEWMYTHYNFDATDIILQKTTFTFDVSVWELFMPLCWGTKMVLCRREDIVSPERILSLIAQHGVTCLHFVPGMLNAFIVALSGIDDIATPLRSLRRVITSGEALQPATVKAWYKRSGVPVHNLYGPTEASVDVTYYPTTAADNIIPIGKPIWNTQLYITGSAGELVPEGVIGEINIAGDGLARGYLNNEKLTAEKFVSNPFTPGTKMYRTGDHGRWLPDGNIEFIGRKDDQVKIRGYRIELGEIETALLEHDVIDAATVIARAGAQGDKELVAYIVSKEVLNVPSLRTYLGTRLPSYMVPAHFVQIAAMPLTASGKVDRKQLPDAQGTAMSAAVQYVAPTNDVEEQLVEVYQEVLRKEQVGIKDDFFALGGDSIKSIQVTSRLKQKGYFVTIQDILLHPIVEDLAKHVTIKTEAEPVLEEVLADGSEPGTEEGFTYKGLSAEQLQKLNQML